MDLFELTRDSLLKDLPFAALAFAFGWVVNEIRDRILARSWETRLKEKTQAAVEAIYEAEKAIPGKGKGAERLVYAVKTLMRTQKIKNYQTAQKEILAVFPLTRLSE